MNTYQYIDHIKSRKQKVLLTNYSTIKKNQKMN